MRSFIYFSLIHSLLGASAVLAAVPLSSVPRTGNLDVVPNKVIIEVDTLASIPNKRAYARVLDSVYDSIKARDVDFEVDKEFDAQGIFVGASLTINDTPDAVKLDTIPGVKAIYPVRLFKRPEPVTKQIVKAGDAEALPSYFSTHAMTGVDKVHAKGLTGKGVKIGILDTGIDYTHPLLGNGFGFGKKVVGGYDFVGDAYTGRNEPVPDSDPLDQCAGHGTHVAGIIAADPNNGFNITGVAYESTLTAYRIFGCTGSTTDDIIVQALLQGAKDGANVLNLSLGGPDGWTTSVASVVASRLARSGIVLAIAAGNEGSSGSWYTSSPGNGIDVISVASVENTILPSRQSIVSGVQHDPIVYYSFQTLPITGELPIHVLTPQDTTVPDDACNPLPDDTPDLSPFVVIVRRGTCPFVEKIENLKAKGAKAALFYDNGNGPVALSFPDFPASLISAADGQFLVDQFNANVPVKLSFPAGAEIANVANPRGGLVSGFSTYGPSNDFYFKPAVGAPGGNILSLVPTTQGSFAVMSGTSMATPFLAGSAALILEAKGKSVAVAKSIRTLLQTTAKTIPSSQQDGALPQTVSQQGAGLINVYDALFSTTSVSTGQLILNDTAHYKNSQTFVVTNNGKRAQSYKLSHVAAGTALTVQTNSIFTSLGPVPLVNAPAEVAIVPPQFTLRAGESKTVRVTFAPPKGLDASTYPLHSGFIRVAAPGENFHVSYVGLGASLKDKQVVDNTDTLFGVKLPLILSGAGAPQTQPTNYTFVGEDFPAFLYRMAFGSPLVRLDLVDTNVRIDSKLNARGPGGHIYSFPDRTKAGSFAKVKIIGTLYEAKYLSRNNEDPEDNGYNVFGVTEPKFANGTTIANGSYRLLFRALKVTGDRNKQEDYETWLSPIVGIRA